MPSAFSASEEKENKNKIEKKVLCAGDSLRFPLSFAWGLSLRSKETEPFSFVATERADRYLIIIECVSSSVKNRGFNGVF